MKGEMSECELTKNLRENLDALCEQLPDGAILNPAARIMRELRIIEEGRARLKAENEFMKKELQIIAKQERSDEISDDQLENVSFEMAYDFLIDIGRDCLAKLGKVL